MEPTVLYCTQSALSALSVVPLLGFLSDQEIDKTGERFRQRPV